MTPADYRVEIRGPGQAINLALLVVEDALRRAGYEVTVDNESPPNERQTLEFAKSMATGTSVQIDMVHEPWGG